MAEIGGRAVVRGDAPRRPSRADFGRSRDRDRTARSTPGGRSVRSDSDGGLCPPRRSLQGGPGSLGETHSLGPAHATAGSAAMAPDFVQRRAKPPPPQQEDYGRERTRPSGASIYALVLSRSPSWLAVSTAYCARGSRFAVALDIRTVDPGLAAIRRVRSELGWYLIWMSATKRDHCDADRQIQYRRYGSSPSARPAIPLFS
jgi:hypothetical protein